MFTTADIMRGNAREPGRTSTVDVPVTATRSSKWTSAAHPVPRGDPDLVPTVDRWFRDAGFEQVFLSAPQHAYGVGVHRLAAQPRPLPRGVRLFTFVR